jgi:hypothetical protein
LDYILKKYSGKDAEFLCGKVEEHHTKTLSYLHRFGVPEGFLRKEKEKYNQTTSNAIPA